ncbi:hypothetical protein GCM10008957_18690 [Deinococcus ruber]|uniref:Uncharacterized protein n=1 Tax=Deinococcus ruber TaxID=1848197 RepID=A0A918C6J1_9DEIO|nr:hypothetical protein GCM10008957_18690 [Deinococcus ruber]
MIHPDGQGGELTPHLGIVGDSVDGLFVDMLFLHCFLLGSGSFRTREGGGCPGRMNGADPPIIPLCGIKSQGVYSASWKRDVKICISHLDFDATAY